MKLGVFTVLFSGKTFEEMLDYVKDAGLDSVEIGTGGNPGDEFCPLDELLESEDKRKAYLEKVHERGLTISAFSCHNNHIAPNPKEAQETHETFVKTVKLASLMGRSEEHTSELQSRGHLVCRLLLEKKKYKNK